MSSLADKPQVYQLRIWPEMEWALLFKGAPAPNSIGLVLSCRHLEDGSIRIGPFTVEDATLDNGGG